MSALKIYADAVKEDFPELTPVVDNMLIMANDRIAELEAALGDLLRCTEKHVFGDECKAQRKKARAALEGGKKDER